MDVSWASLHHPHLLIPWQYYMKEQGALCTKLVKPKPKPGMKSAEKELAKGRPTGEGHDLDFGNKAAWPSWWPLLTCPCACAQLAGC